MKNFGWIIIFAFVLFLIYDTFLAPDYYIEYHKAYKLYRIKERNGVADCVVGYRTSREDAEKYVEELSAKPIYWER